MQERDEDSLLRPRGSAAPRLSWDDTARAMAAEAGEWSVWATTDGDALESIPWRKEGHRRVAESGASSRPRKGGKK